MLFYLIYFSSCYYLTTKYINTLIIKPFDIFEINITGECAILNKWNELDDLNIDVIVTFEQSLPVFGENFTRTYSFDANTNLKGICFINNPCSIRFINEGDNFMSFVIHFTSLPDLEHSYDDDDDYNDNDEKYYPKKGYNFDSSPFIYYNDHEGSLYIFGIIIPLLFIINGIFVFLVLIKKISF